MQQVPGDTDLPLLLLHTVVKLRLQQAHTSATPTSWMSDVVPLFDKMGVSSYHVISIYNAMSNGPYSQ